MNFDFSDEQKLLREQARRFLAQECPPRVVRSVLESERGYDSALWKGIVQMGWPGTAIPEAYRGLGLGALELCVIAEELGRVLAPVPLSSGSCGRRADRNLCARRRPRRSDSEIDPDGVWRRKNLGSENCGCGRNGGGRCRRARANER
jgi:hypothetical protein